MPQKPETKIVKQITDFIEEMNGNVLKIYGNAVQRSGEPDLIGGIVVLHDGYPTLIFHFAVEVKVPGEDARPLQLYRLDQWKKAGFITGVVHSLDEFKGLLKNAAILSHQKPHSENRKHRRT